MNLEEILSKKITVVDDEDSIHLCFSEEFTERGFVNVEFFFTGHEFLNKYEEDNIEPPILVLLDIDMPGMNGCAVLNNARKKTIFNNTIFVAFTGYLGAQDNEWICNSGFDEIIEKSIDLNCIFEKITYSMRDYESKLYKKLENCFDVAAELSKMRIKSAVLENKYIKKMISPDVFEKLQNNPKDLKPNYTSTSVGFVDIRGFTELSNRISIDEIDEILKLFFTLTSNSVIDEGGFIDKYIGDAMMWFFHGHDEKNNSDKCIKTSISIVNGIKELNDRIKEKLHKKILIQVGIGLASGTCAVGIFGAPNIRFQYSTIGPPVNLASRLCSEARPGEILIGGSIIEHCCFKTKKIGFRSIKGFDHDVELRKIIAPIIKK